MTPGYEVPQRQSSAPKPVRHRHPREAVVATTAFVLYRVQTACLDRESLPLLEMASDLKWQCSLALKTYRVASLQAIQQFFLQVPSYHCGNTQPGSSRHRRLSWEKLQEYRQESSPVPVSFRLWAKLAVERRHLLESPLKGSEWDASGVGSTQAGDRVDTGQASLRLCQCENSAMLRESPP